MLDFLKDIFGFWKGVIVGNSPVAQNITSAPVVSNLIPSLDKILQKPDETPIMLRDVPKAAPVKTINLSEYNPEMVIADAEFTACNSMTENQIQDFITSKGSFLKDYKINDHLTSHWIYKHCMDNGINAKLIISIMQKEQSLISRKVIPTKANTLNYALGVGALSNPMRFLEQWKGMDKQIEGSVIVNMKRYNKAKLKVYPYSYKTDRPEFRILSIQNAATLACYDYTPYVGDQSMVVDGIRYDAPFGNTLLMAVYRKYF